MYDHRGAYLFKTKRANVSLEKIPRQLGGSGVYRAGYGIAEKLVLSKVKVKLGSFCMGVI